MAAYSAHGHQHVTVDEADEDRPLPLSVDIGSSGDLNHIPSGNGDRGSFMLNLARTPPLMS